jgi:hypothetical protein
MTALSKSDLELIEAYLQIPTKGDDSLHWAYEDVCEILGKDPERAWRLTLAMIDHTEDELTLAYVAAGPLEDLLAWYGDTIIERVEELARTNARFRETLCAVWGQKRFQPHIYERVRRVIDANT